jgi:hypothetical protein
MNAWHRLRRRILTPDVAQTRLDVRGFHVKDPASRRRLETVGSSFLGGYAAAAEAARPGDAVPALEAVDEQYRGFAYEGAAMACAVRDALPGGGGRVAAMLTDHDEHVYMAYVGIGWAMARLPRPLWSRLSAPDPLLRWLVLDGYGFHQAYFKTAKYVHRAEREATFPWPGGISSGYAVRAIDQGIGRASWFVAGTDVGELGRIFDRFAPHRRSDLWAGAGLAATYAGGATEEELGRLRAAAGHHAADLAQGSAFAAGARVRAGLVVPHNELATRVLCGLPVEAAAAVTDDAREGLGGDGEVPAYEQWRQRIRAVFLPTGREMKVERT